MNITFLGSDAWRSEPTTGGDRYFHEMAAAAAACGTVHVLATPRAPEDSHRSRLRRVRFAAQSLAWLAVRVPRLRGHVLVHDLTGRATLGITSWLARVVGARNILVVQGIYHHAGTPRARRTLERFLARLDIAAAHVIIANSAATRDAVCALGAKPQRVHVVEPGVRREFLAAALDPPSLGVQPLPTLRVLYVGGQCKPVKGLETLVEALGLLDSPRVHATFVGTCDGPTCGPYVARLRARAAVLGIADRVHFAGRVPDPTALVALMRQHDVLVLPSHWEGYGIAVLEAMCCGLPALVTRRGGAASLVRDGATGFHFEPDRPPELAAILRRFLTDPALASRLGRAAASDVRRLAHDWDVTRAGLIDALQAVRFDRVRLPPLRDGDRVLVIEREGLGDALVLLPALSSLARSFPQLRFDVLASPRSAPAFDLAPGIGRVFVASGAMALLRCVIQLRRVRYACVLVASSLVRHQWLATCTRADWHAGFTLPGRIALLDRAVPWNIHENHVERRLALARALGATAAALPPRPLKRHAARVARWLDASPDDGPLVVLHTRAHQSCNLWRDECWIALARRLQETCGARLVLTGAPPERAALRSLAAHLPGARVAAGMFSPAETLALLQRADLLVTLDTGVMHLGMLAETPTVVVLGGRNPAGEWTPRHAAVRLVQHAVPCSPCRAPVCPLGTRACMQGIETDTVFMAALELLAPAAVTPEVRTCHTSR